jgi:DNA-binding response OmpR family regulator
VDVLSRVLKTRAGHPLVGFTRSAAAIQWLADHTPALVITDHQMPGPDGLDVARALRSHPDKRQIPVLMLTGVSEPAFETAACAAGVDLLLQKPISMRELLAHVEVLLLHSDLP